MTDPEMLACTASAWKGDGRCCRWCDGELKGRQRRWCSQDCADEFGRNHWWNWASGAAARRDGGTCRHCGRNGLAIRAETGRWPLNRKGGPLRFETHHLVPLHTLRREARSWHKTGSSIITVRVKHSDSGCWHHLDGLILLCGDCHVDVHKELSAASNQLVLPTLEDLRKAGAL